MCSFKVNKQSNMKTCVMVVAHKSFEDSVLQRNWGYKVIKVGKGMSDSDAKQRGWLCDDIGENIADENPLYCELTALRLSSAANTLQSTNLVWIHITP